MVPAIGTVVAGVNTRMGVMVVPATWDARVMDVKAVIAVGVTEEAVMARALTPTDKPASALDDIWKPAVTAARAPPRVSPVRVMVMDAVPVAAPAVVRTMVVLVDVAAAVEVAVKDPTLLVMEETVPKK
jgi:hypothetical protein